MLKYIPQLTDTVIEEIPDRVTLAVEISNCRGNCPGCHSPFLRNDIGEELTAAAVDKMIEDNFGITCFLFLGEGNDTPALFAVAKHIRAAHPGLEIAVYSGRESVEDEFFSLFDYVKTGPYIEARGPLNKRSTNQRLYYHRKDITERFWKR
ncbi:MAG: anaerobic ribonucleoside-triphosphate reductase activating protein [Bacteroidales bacterium]|nr:anaerobic ribonucleoside-triphosphate reductase activating protein [Bacteroidales bacterium]